MSNQTDSTKFKPYQPQQVEQQAQAYWQQQQSFQANEDNQRPKYYCLAMFPYPSGKLHMGHVRNYTIGDVISRYQRMQGYNVLQPMGWDAFGLPAENAAIQRQIPPAQWTASNIADMKQQLQQLGFAYDWQRELTTCDPNYYGWEQKLFTQLFKKGLVYRKNALVNWDPVDQTVLANEQVIEGRGWRSGALVERKEIPQWFLKTTAYATELLADIEQLSQWPQQVRTMQQHWIGRSTGARIKFQLSGIPDSQPSILEVFTTRPDTIMGITYLAIAPEHPLAQQAALADPAIAKFIRDCKHNQITEAALATLDKKGIATPYFARHPISSEQLPLWIANFVLMSYGSGAVMAVPAHDQRDWEFAQVYNLPIRQVIAPAKDSVDIAQGAFTEPGILCNSGDFNGLTSAAANTAIITQLKTLNAGEQQINFRLRDWCISRQRYWGTPIPIIYCDQCGMIPVPEEQLPVTLPTTINFDHMGITPLAQQKAFYHTKCPKCQQPAHRETDTFDTFMESSWYYARYTCPKEQNDILNRQQSQYWLPVDQYVGGIEHAVLHLLYARLFHKILRDLGYVPGDEPFLRLLCQGMVVAETFYQQDESGKKTYFNLTEVQLYKNDKGQIISAKRKQDNSPVTIGAIEKMSKSKNNGIDPQYLIQQYGADTVRLFIMFAAPPDQKLEWNNSGVEGAHRFLKRIWQLTYHFLTQKQLHSDTLPALVEHTKLTTMQQKLRFKTHSTISKVTDDISRRYTFNTAIASIMELSNAIAQYDDASPMGLAVLGEAIESLLLMLAPVVPHICQQLWFDLGYTQSIIDTPWPKLDEQALIQREITMIVQVNGKVRSKINLPVDAKEQMVIDTALAEKKVQNFTTDKPIRKTIVVPNKLINIVV